MRRPLLSHIPTAEVAYTGKGNNAVYAIYMPAKDEKQLPGHILVRTKFEGKPKVSLLASKQNLEYQRFEDMLMVAVPENLRTKLAAQEAVVIKVSR